MASVEARQGCDSLEKSLTLFFEKHPNIEQENTYAVAVSGGPDSMALAYALHQWAERTNKELHILTVDHGLRTEAAAEAGQVGKWITALNSDKIQHKILKWEGDKPDNAIMEQARAARYDLMAQYCQAHQIQTLFVGHHQDDQAETFLIRLVKGSGLDGLAAMNDLRVYNDDVKIARPFLDLPKQDLVKFCEENDVKFITDPSNENEKYLRPRFRQSMDILTEEGLSVSRLVTLTRRLSRARNALEQISDVKYNEAFKEKSADHIVLNFEIMQNQPEEIAFRLLQKAVKELRGAEDYGVRMDRLENLFASLWTSSEGFKPRTLGGLIFALKDKKTALYIKKE